MYIYLLISFLRPRFIKRYINEITCFRKLLSLLDSNSFEKKGFNNIKDINLINDLDLLKIQHNYKQHYNDKRNYIFNAKNVFIK